MFDSLAVLKDGNAKLRAFNPVLCGTIPLAIDVADSDLDIIMEVNDFVKFRSSVEGTDNQSVPFTISSFQTRTDSVLSLKLFRTSARSRSIRNSIN